jgi:hypothetical protein
MPAAKCGARALRFAHHGARRYATVVVQAFRPARNGRPEGLHYTWIGNVLADRKDIFQVVGRTWNDVHADQFADAAGGGGAGIGCGFD